MQALAIGEYGGPEQAQVQELPDPAPGQGEVLVRVRAAALNPLDVKIRNGAMRAMFDAPMPLVLGWDGAGVVERVGPDVQGSPSATRCSASCSAAPLPSWSSRPPTASWRSSPGR